MSSVEKKILKYLEKVQIADFAQIVNHIGSEVDARDFIAVLARDRLVVRDAHDSSKFKLSAAGRSALVSSQDNVRQRWLDRLWGFLSGVAVAVIGGVILQTLVG